MNFKPGLTDPCLKKVTLHRKTSIVFRERFLKQILTNPPKTAVCSDLLKDSLR